ncbi:unnamed protein product [Paramecium primaurelia]|uniref:Uncharacterized protein n=1 Tax=Paramecium primaurelia TaxID=5886 RepID=A0A8S1QM65_PARPR|nr:unnamed protein product [Paramecium primaurelia]
MNVQNLFERKIDYEDQSLIISSIRRNWIRFTIKINRGLWKENRNNAFVLYPSSQISNNFIDSYNAVYSTRMMTEYCNSVVAFDNQAIQNVIDNQTGLDYVDYNLLNNIIAQVIGMYTGIRGHKNTQQYDVFKYVSISFTSFPNPIKWQRIKYKQIVKNLVQEVQLNQIKLFQSKMVSFKFQYVIQINQLTKSSMYIRTKCKTFILFT